MGIPDQSILRFLVYALLISLPFSIAINSIVLGLMAIWVIFNLISKPLLRQELINRKSLLTWLFIPLVYGFTLLYSQNLSRGIEQWFNLFPVIVLPLFFTIFKLKYEITILIKSFTVIIILVGLIQFLQVQGIIHLTNREQGFSSVFYDGEKHSFIIWSAIMISSWYNNSSRFWQIVIPLLYLNLFYYGQLNLILITVISGMLMSLIGPVAQTATNFPRVIIFGSSVLILSLVFFSHFRAQLSDGLYNIVALYTHEAWTKQAIDYFSDLKFSIAQWAKHPFTGVGLGDYLDAMWNEYREHGLEAPGYPQSQLFHMLVSTGISGFIALYLVFDSWKKKHKKYLNYVLITFLVLLFAAPFKSQISATALMIVTYLIPDYEERE